MDGRRFDNLVKAAVGGAPSRRRVLKGLAGGAAAPVLGLVAGERAAAGSVSVAGAEGFCAGKRAIGNAGRCIADGCRGRRSCGCANDAAGTKRCVNLFYARCPGRDECDSNDQCRRGEVCTQVGACCDSQRFNICVPLCGTETNRAASEGGVPEPFATGLAGG